MTAGDDSHFMNTGASGGDVPVHFRYLKKNTYSLSSLLPVLPEADLVQNVADGVMIYSFFTNQKDEIFREAAAAKKRFALSGRRSFFIAGGPHPSGAPEETADIFDAVVVGEGEETLPELVSLVRSALAAGVFPSAEKLSGIKGIVFRSETGEYVRTPKRDLVDLDRYPCFLPDNMWRPLEISRGCPFGCKYCQTPRLFGRKMRHRSVSEIVRFAKYYDDLRFITSNAFAYGSDGRVAAPEKVEALLSALSKLEPVAADKKRLFFGTFPSEVRPDFVSGPLLDILIKYADNRTLSIGAQSGSDRILKEIARGHGTNAVLNALDLCFDRGIVPIVDFIVGFPAESAEDQEKTLSLINDICRSGGEVRAHYLTPLPGTPYADVTPAPVSADISGKLGRLALGGKLKGVWENMSASKDENGSG